MQSFLQQTLRELPRTEGRIASGTANPSWCSRITCFQNTRKYDVKLPTLRHRTSALPPLGSIPTRPYCSLGAASMQQVADWLEKLGLGQYVQRFAENDISFS